MTAGLGGKKIAIALQFIKTNHPALAKNTALRIISTVKRPGAPLTLAFGL
jgi:hypothetical protein